MYLKGFLTFNVSPGYRHIDGCLHWCGYFQRAHHSHVEGRGSLHPPGWVPLQQLPRHVEQGGHQHPRPQGEKHRHDLIHVHLVIISSPTCWWKVNFQAQQTCVCVSKNVYLAKLWKTQQKCAQVGDDGSILQLQWVGDLWAWGARNVSVIKPKKQTQEGDADLGWTLGQKTSAMTDVIL